MKLLDAGPGISERDRVQKVLNPGEELLWVGKPHARLTDAGMWRPFVFPVFMLVCFAAATHEDNWMLLAMFQVVGLYFVVCAWLERRRKQRALYAITSQRALVLHPSFASARVAMCAIPVSPDMLKDECQHKDGRMDLSFGPPGDRSGRAGHWNVVFYYITEGEYVKELLERLQQAASDRKLSLESAPGLRLADAALTRRDAELLDSVMQEDEHLIWAGKPVPRFFTAETTGLFFFSLPWMALISFIIWAFVSQSFDHQVNLWKWLFTVPFILFSLFLFLSPLWNYLGAVRTAYALTNRRALLLKPAFVFFKKTARKYPVRMDMLRELRIHKDGSGDIVLAYEERRSRHGSYDVPVGFMHIRDAARVANLIRGGKEAS